MKERDQDEAGPRKMSPSQSACRRMPSEGKVLVRSEEISDAALHFDGDISPRLRQLP